MNSETPTVFVVDDDEGARNSLSWLLESIGLQVETYPDAQSYIDNYTPGQPGCLILDIRMPGMNGMQLLEWLQQQELSLPTVIVTGHGDIQMAVRAMKSGAIDFLEKPYNALELTETVQRAIKQGDLQRQIEARKRTIQTRYDNLTKREQEVAMLLYQSQPNKRIASALDLSVKTVEAYRSRVMKKMEAQSAVELVQLMRDAEIN